MRTILTVMIVATFVIALSGCMGNPASPFQLLSYQEAPDRVHKNLIVFLPGLGGTLNCPLSPHKCFEAEGFVAAVQARKLPFDMVAPNAHYRYYQARTLVPRLTKDVIMPARDAGYEKIWLVGVSMGGLGALYYLKEGSLPVDGVLILGPYLGDDEIIAEIVAHGRLADWHSGRYLPEKQWQRALWDWLKGYPYTQDAQTPIYLGVGTRDRYITAHRLLADHMPGDHVIEMDGKHRFSTFKSIWDIFLEREILPR